MRILFLSQRVPFPPNRGDKITTWRIVERMQRRHEVTCIAFAHDDEDRRAARELEARGIRTITVPYRPRWALLKSSGLLLTRTPLTLGVYGSRRLQEEVDRCIGSVDLAYAYSSSMGIFVLPYADIARVMHFADVDSDKWRQYALRSMPPKSWIYRREWSTLLEVERQLADAFDESIVCTSLEQQVLQQQIPGARSAVLRNGVDVEYFAPASDQSEPGQIVFTGVMNYYPNVDACTFFARDVFPRVRAHFPQARFTIVGAHAGRNVQALAHEKGVIVTGFVPDVRDYLRRASVAVAPLRIARGIQNKALEAMAMALPVVGTTAATQGIGGTAGEHYLVADDAAGQAEAICGLLADPRRAKNLGHEARRFVERHYDWEDCFSELDRILERCMSRQQQRGGNAKADAAGPGRILKSSVMGSLTGTAKWV